MFDKLPIQPAFFEFAAPVFFDGLGYVKKVALLKEFASRECPAVAQYIAAADGYLFVMENGSTTAVSSANVQFLAGKAAPVVDRAGDGKEEGIRGSSVASKRDEGSERQSDTHRAPSNAATEAAKPVTKPKPAPETGTKPELYTPPVARLPAAALTPQKPRADVPQKRKGAW